MATGSKDNTCILATLPEEQHEIGLQMAAVALSLTDVDIVYLGPNTPIESIVRATEFHSSIAVLLSISDAAPPDKVAWQVEQVRQRITPVKVLVGGSGAHNIGGGVICLESLTALYEWADQL